MKTRLGINKTIKGKANLQLNEKRSLAVPLGLTLNPLEKGLSITCITASAKGNARRNRSILLSNNGKESIVNFMN